MRSELDDLLESSAPPIARRTADLTAELNRIVVEAELLSRSGRRRARRRFALAGLTVAAVLGVGAGANAGGLIDLIPEPQSASWLSDDGTVVHEFALASGEKCEVTYAIEPSEVEGLNRLRSGMSADEWSAAMDDAHAYMASIQDDDIDLAAAVERFKSADATVRQQLTQNGVPATELSPTLSSDETSVLAFGAELLHRVQTHLEADGHDPAVITIASGNSCRELS